MDEQKSEAFARRPFFRATRTILLAAVGAAALAQDEMKEMLERLVERGEMADTEARQHMREYLERRERREQERQAAAKKDAPAPQAADVEALNARIAELTRQIEELKREKAG